MMKKWLASAVLSAAVLVGCSQESTITESIPSTQSDTEAEATAAAEFEADLEAQMESRHGRNRGAFVIADRGSGTISVIDERSYDVTAVELPAADGEPTPEPMYVVSNRGRVFVGDRANNRVAVFDPRDYDVIGTVPAGAGVFHMWATPNGRQLWVNNDIDNTTTIINTRTLQVIATADTPADLVAIGGRPHDVIVGPHGRFAYVSVLTNDPDNDYVVQYSARTFQEVGRAAVGKDPHLSLARQHRKLYVPCQNSNVVIVLDRRNLEEITRIDVPGAHGAAHSPNGRIFYTANLPGGGTDALWAIDTHRDEIVGGPVDSPYPVPHNIALDRNGKALFLTHSGGSADKVTIYKAKRNGDMEYRAEVTVGINPFGLAYVGRR